MRLKEYPRINSLLPDNVFVVDGPNGTKSILASDIGFTPEMHRMTFRGKNLGNAVTSQQQTDIQNGTFNDLFTGDYWVIDNMAYRITDMNYWLGCGDTAFNRPHLVMMSDDQLYSAVMNATNITTGGYPGSEMRTTHLTPGKNTIKAAFPGLVLTKRTYMENAVTNGKPGGGAWFDSEIDLPNEINMYGSFIFRPANDGITIPVNYTIDRSQFALFALQPKFIICGPHWLEKPLVTRRNMWLRDPVSATHFALMRGIGPADVSGAATSYGVRPTFAIG